MVHRPTDRPLTSTNTGIATNAPGKPNDPGLSDRLGDDPNP